MKNIDFTATRYIGEEYQDKTEEGIKATSIDNAMEQFALRMMDNHDIQRDGSGYIIEGENEAGKQIQYFIDNIKVTD